MEYKKNIWIINHYSFPYGYGFHTRLHTISLMLKKLGYVVTVFASSFNHLKTKEVVLDGIYKEEIIDDIKYIWVKTEEYSGNGFGRIKNIFEFSKNLNSIYKQFLEKPDIIWASSPQPFVIYNALKMKKYFKCKFIYEERDIWPLTLQVLNGINKYHPLSMLFRYLQLQAYKHSDLIVTPLDNLNEYIKKSGILNKRIEFLPQPFVKFNIDKFNTYLPSNKFVIGYVGSVGHSNSVFNLIKAANLLKEIDDLYFVIVGDGPQIEEIKDYVKNNKITNIHFFGKLEKEKAMYIVSICDLLYKGNPNIDLYKYGIGSIKLAEYLWFNKPIIHATNIKNDLVSLSNSGLLIKSDNEFELKNAILKLKNDRELYNNYSDNGKKYVKENFLENKIQEKLKNILETL